MCSFMYIHVHILTHSGTSDVFGWTLAGDPRRPLSGELLNPTFFADCRISVLPSAYLEAGVAE